MNTVKDRPSSRTSITGRDGYIITQALAYASEVLRHLGLPHDEPSNRADMDAILEARCGVGGADHYRAAARAKLNRDPECYVPNDDGTLTLKYPAHDWTLTYEGSPTTAHVHTDVITANGGEIVGVVEQFGYTTIHFTAPSQRIVKLRELLTVGGAEMERG